ncbi:hypothetical protein V6N11_067805 [Hibiscus sabdariffa]|uniref:Uncharacterized protein n=1 Tax=Hibiscus sabdariffa TaxID=183260 RepID=A0ABR2SS55_9ROSI
MECEVVCNGTTDLTDSWMSNVQHVLEENRQEEKPKSSYASMVTRNRESEGDERKDFNFTDDVEKPSEMTSTTRQFDEFGGRPPDGCPVISPLVPLERPPSPMLLEEQSVGKKARNGVDVATFSDKVDMDADHESDVVCDVRDSAVRNPPLSQE